MTWMYKRRPTSEKNVSKKLALYLDLIVACEAMLSNFGLPLSTPNRAKRTHTRDRVVSIT